MIFNTFALRGSIEDYLTQGVTAWFIEYKKAKKDVVKVVSGGKEIGHFIQMSFGANTAVGCAMVMWEDGGSEKDLGVDKYTRFTCNYKLSPYVGEPLYEIAK